MKDHASRKYVGGLDLARLLAAVLVMTFHLLYVQWYRPDSSQFSITRGAPQFPEFESIAWFGWIGVEIFFVISGFVIIESAEGKSANAFLLGRLKRLVPTNWICATIVCAIFILFGINHWKYDLYLYARTLTFIPLTFLPPYFPWLDTVYWSLTVEVVFYSLVFAVLWANCFAYIEWLAAALALYSLTYLVGHTFNAFGAAPIISLAQYGCFFALGIAIWLASVRGATAFRILLGVLSFAACVIEISIPEQREIPVVDGLNFLLPYFVWLAAVLGIIFFAYRPYQGSKFTQTLGRMTYPLYLLHSTLGCAVLKAAPITGKYIAALLAFVVSLIASLGVVKIERHIVRFLGGATSSAK